MKQKSNLYTFLRWAVLAFSAVGIVDAAYLSYARLTHTGLTCTVFDGCNAVAGSSYSVLLGIIPLAYLGLVFYLAIFALGIALFFYDRPIVRILLLAATSIGIVSSGYFLYVQAVLINAYCLYCVISAGLSIVLFILALVLRRMPPSKHAQRDSLVDAHRS